MCVVSQVSLNLPLTLCTFVSHYSTRYNVEKRFRSPPPSRPSVEEQRTDRLLKELVEEEKLAPIKDKTFVPKTIFERNVSPGLLEGEDGKG